MSGAAAPARGLSASALKYIAIAAMLIDHATYLAVPYYSPAGIVLHWVGRITGPVMFYFVAEGYRHTRDANRYTLRLAVVAALSYLPFIYFETGALPTADSWLELNVIYTLLLGLLALRATCEIRVPWLRFGAVLALVLASGVGDWGYFGPVCILAFYFLQGSYPRQAAAFVLLALLDVFPQIYEMIRSMLLGLPPETYQYLVNYLAVQSGMLVPIVLLGFYNGQRGRGSKWLFYVFYPAHLLVLGAIRFAVMGG